MTKKVLLSVSVVFFVMLTAKAQEVQWANEILDYSTELHNLEFSAEQALGKPNVYPAGEESPNAWIPGRDDKIDFIQVGFEKPMKIRQVAVAESLNAGSTFKVELFDLTGEIRDTYEFETMLAGLSRMKTIQFNLTDYKVAAVKVYVDSKAVPGYTAIDAIGITTSEEPVDIAPEVHQGIDKELVVKRLGRNINSSFADFRPIISPDGSRLYFSRKNHPHNYGGEKDLADIWYSDWDEKAQEWGTAQNLVGPFNNLGPNYISCFIPTGKKSMGVVLGNAYTKNNEQMKFGISMAQKDGDEWSEPQKLDIKKFNSFSDRVNVFMANNRKVMIISMEDAKSKGGRDLYVSFMSDDNIWTKPERMGEMINSIADESGPFLASDNRTLYFSSEGFSGYGKNDIFVTTRLDDTWLNWSEPKNLGNVINSKDDDLFFHMLPNGEEAYFTRAVEYGDYDIFKVPMPIYFKPNPVATIRGTIFNSLDGKPIKAKITYKSVSEGKEVGHTYSDARTGQYEIMLPKGDAYTYKAEVDGLFTDSQSIDLTSLKESVVYTHNLSMTTESEDVKHSVTRVYFDINSTMIPAEEIQDLDDIAARLKTDPDLRLDIKGHTDDYGTAENNLEVSKKRAEVIVDYMVNKGIEERRLEWEGFGETEPLASNLDEDEGRALNRRVELKLEREINSLAIMLDK